MQPNPKCQLLPSQETHIPKVSIGMPVSNGEKFMPIIGVVGMMVSVIFAFRIWFRIKMLPLGVLPRF